jgi:hypothetical protein
MKTKVSPASAAHNLYPTFVDIFTLWDKGHLTPGLMPKKGCKIEDINDCLENESGYGGYKSVAELRRGCEIVVAMVLAGDKASK